MPTALLIIDVQQILCAGANAAYDFGGVISRINMVSRKARIAGAGHNYTLRHGARLPGDPCIGRAFDRRQWTPVSSSNIGPSQQDSLKHRELWTENNRSACQ